MQAVAEAPGKEKPSHQQLGLGVGATDEVLTDRMTALTIGLKIDGLIAIANNGHPISFQSCTSAIAPIKK